MMATARKLRAPVHLELSAEEGEALVDLLFSEQWPDDLAAEDALNRILTALRALKQD
jgi:hypothetical protein